MIAKIVAACGALDAGGARFTGGLGVSQRCRTIVRRAERDVVRLAAEDAVTPALLRYLNRLSDHLFVLARVLNGNGADDVLWTPGANLAPR